MAEEILAHNLGEGGVITVDFDAKEKADELSFSVKTPPPPAEPEPESSAPDENEEEKELPAEEAD